MSEVENIKKRILGDAEKDASSILNEAKDNIKQMKEEAGSKSKEEVKKINESAMKDSSAERHRILSSAKLQSHNLKLASQEELIGEVLETSKKKLGGLRKSKQRYEKALMNLANDGLSEISSTELVLIASAEDKELCKALAKELKTEVGKPADILGGVIVETKDGSIRVDNSFEKRIEREGDLLRNEIAKALFAKGGKK